MVTQLSESNEPDLKEGLKSGKNVKTLRKISLNCTVKRASKTVSHSHSIYLKFAYI